MILSTSSKIICFNLPSRLHPSPSRVALQGIRNFASELDVQDYDFMLPTAFDMKKSMGPTAEYNPKGKYTRWIEDKIRLRDRYQARVYARVPESTKEYPNLVYSHGPEDRVIGCICEKDSMHANYWILKNDGKARRCECGVWYKITDAEPGDL